MRNAARVLSTVIFVITLGFGSVIFVFGSDGANFVVRNDEVPEVTARVARISFIRGDGRIKRSGLDEWEKATLNLPMVEGDEILTDADSRIEIQFDNDQHLRLAENSYLKIITLKDEGIAVSLSVGTLNLRSVSFDKDRAFFEIDIPKTTIAIQRSGSYRVDAGREGETEVRVAATGGGEARVYSDNAGFTIKNGRSARIHTDGPSSGEWETAEAVRYADEFDTWSADRDEVIAQRLKDAYYDKYYDRDIYGADDLNDYGSWVNTQSYGHVWRPHRNAISHYADWTPYRYGHWRWMPPYGWIWVNDEPWGWATYHHGRWFYDDGYWNWSPYGYYRHARSWWHPALVVINIFNDNVCWYPLPYHYGYYNYNVYNNYYYVGHNNNNPQTIHQTGGIKPIPTRSPQPIGPAINNGSLASDVVPPTGVVTLAASDFGVKAKGNRTASASVARSVLSLQPDAIKASPLPVRSATTRAIGRDIAAERPKINNAAMQARVGAAPRRADKPLDNELRITRILGGRSPVVNGDIIGSPNNVTPRKTGAVERVPIIRQSTPPVRQAPIPPPRVREDTTDPPASAPPVRQPPVRQTPRYEQPPREETPRSDPPPVKQSPRVNPPTRQTTPKSDPPPVRQSPPDKSDPKPLTKTVRKADADG